MRRAVFIVAPAPRRENNTQLRRLYREQERRCYFCRCLTVLPKDRPNEIAAARDKKRRALPEATRDHLYPAGHKLRHRCVMSCFACNHKRGDPALDILFD